MASRGRGARQKGSNFERLVAAMISEVTGLKAKRGLGQARDGGKERADVEMPFFHIEAKRQARCNIKAAMNQAVSDAAEKSKIPIVVTKDDRCPILVTLLWDDFVKFLNAFLLQCTQIDVPKAHYPPKLRV
jgi:hypothetical protein